VSAEEKADAMPAVRASRRRAVEGAIQNGSKRHGLQQHATPDREESSAKRLSKRQVRFLSFPPSPAYAALMYNSIA